MNSMLGNLEKAHQGFANRVIVINYRDHIGGSIFSFDL